MTDFEKQVLSDLAVLKTQMRSLMGNGHPGRIAELEARVARHDVFIHRAGGIAAAVAALLTLLHVAFDYLRLR